MSKSQFDQIPETALSWHDQGKKVALATVLETWGSAPRQAGAQLAVSSDGNLMGSVSGGCVEGAVALEAYDAMEDGKCRVLEYGVADDEAFAVGMACGGTIRILVEPLDIGDGPSVEMLRELVASRQDKRPMAMVTNLSTWKRRLVSGTGDPLDDIIHQGFRTDKSQISNGHFVAIFNPPLRLAIVGAVHIAQSLSDMARACGFEVAIIDPRESFLTKERFPHDTLLDLWPDEGLKAWGLDPRTAVVTLAHDPKIDLPAIETALASDAFYLGCLGSKKTQAKRKDELLDRGVEESDLVRIHGPVGVGIGAKTPAEISISIMAEMIDKLRHPENRP